MLSFAALPVLRASGQWSLSLPNSLNFSFSFHYFLIFIMALYLPRKQLLIPHSPPLPLPLPSSLSQVFPQLYGHMISQRRKVIGGKSKKE